MTLVVRGRVWRALVALPLLAVPASLRASGFAIESQGARASGLAGAYVAQSTDPSAISHNAAGIAFLRGRQLYLAGSFLGLSTDFTGEGPVPDEGRLETADRNPGVLPAIYYSHALGRRTVIGVGVSRPFAMRSTWDDPDSFTGRQISIDSRIASWSINPTIAHRVADRLAVGVGLDVRLSTFEVARRVAAEPNPFPPKPTDVAELAVESGTEAGVGFNLGLLASPTEDLSFGIAYRHQVAIEHGALARFTQIPTGVKEVDDAVKAALPPSQNATASFTYPGRISAGVALRRFGWTIAADFEWTLWSSFDEVYIAFATSSAFDTVLPQGWASTWRGALGVEYAIGDRWEVRGGYGYDRSPAPAETISPFLHDSHRHTFAAGGSWRGETLRLDVSLGYALHPARSTLGTSRYDYDGSYGTRGLRAGASLGYRF